MLVLKNAFFALGYTKHGMVAQISSSLATIGQQVGDLRNEIGISSHGKSLEEVKERNNKVDGDEWKAVSNSTESISKGQKVEIISRESIIVTVKLV